MDHDVIAGLVLLAIVVFWVLGALVGEVLRDAGRRVDWTLKTSLDPRPDYEGNVVALDSRGREANR